MAGQQSQLVNRRYVIFAGAITAAIIGILLMGVSVHPAGVHMQKTPIHKDIITTVFWVGEQASSDNGNIANVASAWDEQWQAHYGGVDDPNARHIYYPAAFKPRENPFYVALPYDDLDNAGLRKPTAGLCPNAKSTKLKHSSWCKNTWLKLQNGDKTAYAQWEDVGPYQENDVAYVFGTSQPVNRIGAAAGLDISPAVRDYLRVGDVSRTSWNFVTPQTVPVGPWRQIISSSPGESVN